MLSNYVPFFPFPIVADSDWYHRFVSHTLEELKVNRKPIRITQSPEGGIAFDSKSFRASGRTLPPNLRGAQASSLRFTDPIEEAGSIGGIAGKIRRETSREGGLEVTRECFRSDDGVHAAVRMRVKNAGKASIHLNNLIPFQVEGDGRLLVDEADMIDWRVMKMSRLKSDIPGCYRPAKTDLDYQDAAFNSANVKAGLGVQGDLGEYTDMSQILAEPCIFIKNERDEDAPGLFLGVMGQEEHLSTIFLVPSEDHQSLTRLNVVCEFDNVLVDSGEERHTHWIMLFEAPKESDSLWEYVEILADEFGYPKPKGPEHMPTVFCTWYFYGREFYEKDLDENIEEMKKRPMHCDTFLLDNGWMDAFGDWNANSRFPDGMKTAAEKIRAAGYTPGIWTTPVLVMKKSKTFQEHPELMARDAEGELIPYDYTEGDTFVVDPTSPYLEDYFRSFYPRLVEDGYRYHKLDFLRALVLSERVQYQNPKTTRAQGYRHLIATLRKVLGDDVYIEACGGIFDAGHAGLVDACRITQDSQGHWVSRLGVERAGEISRVKANMVRSYTSRLWHNNADALMLRINEKPYFESGAAKHKHISLGKFTDDEAFTTVAKTYVSGSMVQVSEKMQMLQDSRRDLFRHLIPSMALPCRVVDFEAPDCPTLMLTRVTPRCGALAPWYTLCVGNWYNKVATRTIRLSGVDLPKEITRVAVFEFVTQQFLGVKDISDSVTIEIPVHGTRVLRIVPYEVPRPVLLGTDLHITGGGCEIAAMEFSDTAIRGTLDTPWEHPVTITAGFPENGSLRVVQTVASREAPNFVLQI